MKNITYIWDYYGKFCDVKNRLCRMRKEIMEERRLMVNAEYYPRIKRENIIKNCKCALQLKHAETYGSGFAVVATAIIQGITSTENTEGLYHCVFPEGITGHLAKFKDGSGLTGTIVGECGFAGQARWIPVEGSTIQLAIDPVSIAVAVAIFGINKRLDSIKETQKEILQFLHQDKESELEGAMNSLSDILEQFQFNSTNRLWKGSQLTIVTSIKGKAEHNIIFYRKEIAKILEKKKGIHIDQNIIQIKRKLEHNFKYYQLGTYLYAYASFLEIMLGENRHKDFLGYIENKIEEYSLQYRLDYSKCYEKLENFSYSTIQSKALVRLGAVGKSTGNIIAKIPVISKGSVDEVLIDVGNKIEKVGSKHAEKVMEEFRNNREAGIQIFIENIRNMNSISNHPVELFFDRNELYVCTE